MDGTHQAMKFARSLIEGKSDLLGNEITILNNIWLGKGRILGRNVQTLMAKYYVCDIKLLPTAKNNVDVANLKKKLTKEQRPRGRHDEEIRTAVLSNISPRDLLLTSVFYVKMGWREAFIENCTKIETFHISETERTTVEMMVQKCGHVCASCENINATVLQLPLTAHNMSMFVFLPQDTKSGLIEVLKKLTPANFKTVVAKIKQSKPKPIHVSLPKFSLKLSSVKPAAISCETDENIPVESDDNVAGDCKLFQTTKLTINEYGLNAEKTGPPQVTITGPAVHDGIKWTHFSASSPFVFMLLDTECELIFATGKLVRPEPINDVKRMSSKIQRNRNWCCI